MRMNRRCKRRTQSLSVSAIIASTVGQATRCLWKLHNRAHARTTRKPGINSRINTRIDSIWTSYTFARRPSTYACLTVCANRSGSLFKQFSVYRPNNDFVASFSNDSSYAIEVICQLEIGLMTSSTHVYFLVMFCTITCISAHIRNHFVHLYMYITTYCTCI